MGRYKDLKTLLKKNRASLTKPRRIIFDLLLDQRPQTMQVLVKRATGKVDRATVYRTMELFERLGVANRLNIGWKYKYELSDIFLDHHHHFYCTNCGKSFDMPSNPMLETMVENLTVKEGFAPHGHQLEVFGLCSTCLNN